MKNNSTADVDLKTHCRHMKRDQAKPTKMPRLTQLIEQVQPSNLHIALLRRLENDGLERQARQCLGIVEFTQFGLHLPDWQAGVERMLAEALNLFKP